MNDENIEQALANLAKRIDKLERHDQTTQPPNLDPHFEAGQEMHQAALASFQTTKKDGVCTSLNSATAPADADALLKKLEKDEAQQDAGADGERTGSP
jgi:hypothetical protein